MIFLGIDYGEKRIGLASGDSELGLASPMGAAVEPTEAARLARIAKEIERRGVTKLIVGYPLNMDGSAGFKAREVDTFIAKLEESFGLPVERVDERLSSRVADASLVTPKKKKRTIKQRQAERRRGERDSRAAAVILQDYLDAQAEFGGPEKPEQGAM